MATVRQQPKAINNNDFYRQHYNKMIIALIVAIFLMLTMVIVVLYQLSHRPLPQFNAVAPNGQMMELTAGDEPNLLSSTLLKWARKAAVAAYTFDFVNYEKQIALARPYFTEAGWGDYQNSISNLLGDIKQNQLFVNGVVAGAPVISNQGELPGHGYTWRVQLPFLVTYQSAESKTSRTFTVIMTIVRVPTWENPAGIGVDQFVMAR